MADMTARDTDWTERWREVAGQHWVTVAERCGAMAGRFGASMLDAADRKAGERVLDVGCEHGATRVEAARRGRRGGVAVGIDLSAAMLGLARQRAAAVGSNAVWFASGDVESRVSDMTVPQTRYTSLGEADIAYQVHGEGPLDLVYANGLTEHIDMQWEHPLMARFLERLASFSRLIMFDRRGAGASDPVPLDALPTWEEWTDDLRAVLDAVGSERAAIYASLDAGPVGMIFAATHPERTSALILGNTAACYAKAEDYPEGATPETVEGIVELLRTTWGTEELIAAVYPSMAGDPAFLRWRAKLSRASATPRTAAEQYRYIFGMDVRSVLSTIGVPTLVLHRSNLSLVPVEHGRYLADHIAGREVRGGRGGRRLVLHRGRRGGLGRGGGVPHRGAAAG